MGEEKTVKPQVLYHASSNRDIKVFEPRNESIRHPSEGPVVFATASKIEASKFLVKTDDSWTNLGAFNSVHFMLCSDRKRFEEIDKGGTIYHLPSNSFIIDERFNKGTNEWTSRTSVVPIGRDDYESGLEAMINFGVQIFFVDREMFNRVQNSDDHGYSIIKSLKSENMRKDVNVIKIV